MFSFTVATVWRLYEILLTSASGTIFAFLSEFSWKKKQLLLSWSQGYRDRVVEIEEDCRRIEEIAAFLGELKKKEENRKGMFIALTAKHTRMELARAAGWQLRSWRLLQQWQ